MTEHKTEEELKQKLSYILPAVVSSSFYRKKYGIEGLTETQAKHYITEHFYELPVLTREEIPELTPIDTKDGRYARLMLTGGTSGISTVITWCDEDMNPMASPYVKRLQELGIQAGDYVFSTVPVGMSIYGVIIESICKAAGLQHIEFERFPFDHPEIPEVLLRKYQPKLFFGTPAGLLEMIKIPAIRQVLQSLKVAAIGGAIASEKDITSIEETLNCRVLDMIGATECGVYGLKERECSGFHIFESQTIELELLEPDEHGIGNCALTNFYNTRMPLLRYVNGDRGSVADTCSCGYKGKVFTLTGRISETCYLGGSKIGADCFTHLAQTLGVNTTFQALVYPKESPQRVQLNIVDTPVPWTMQQVLMDFLQTNVALSSKISSGSVAFDIAFIKEEQLIGLNDRGKWRRVLEQ